MIGWKIENVTSVSVVNRSPPDPVYDHPLPPVYANVTCPFCVRLSRSDIATAPLYTQSRVYKDRLHMCPEPVLTPSDEDGAWRK